jgi:hypothetical protein
MRFNADNAANVTLLSHVRTRQQHDIPAVLARLAVLDVCLSNGRTVLALTVSIAQWNVTITTDTLSAASGFAHAIYSTCDVHTSPCHRTYLHQSLHSLARVGTATHNVDRLQH